jgi:protein-disulfide isomerase
VPVLRSRASDREGDAEDTRRQLRFAYRHFPLSQIHPHSFQAAEPAEAAGAQDRFWEMHDMLFEHQDRLTTQDFLAYAGALELALEPFARTSPSTATPRRFVRTSSAAFVAA